MTLPALLAGLAVLVLVGLPGASAVRLQQALPAPAVVPAPRARPGLPVLPALPVPPLAAAAGLALGLVADGAALGVVLAVLAASAAAGHRRRRAAAAAAAERAAAGEACAVLAAELRAGRTAAAALDAAAEVGRGAFRDRLRAGAAAARLGGDVGAALRAGPATSVPAACAGLAACWQVCAGTGAGLAAAVERLEEGLRSEATAQRAVQSELAGPRATAGLLAVLPLAGIALAAGLGARPLHVLLHTAVGTACLLLGVALDLLGLAWTRRIAARAGG